MSQLPPGWAQLVFTMGRSGVVNACGRAWKPEKKSRRVYAPAPPAYGVIEEGPEILETLDYCKTANNYRLHLGLDSPAMLSIYLWFTAGRDF